MECNNFCGILPLWWRDVLKFSTNVLVWWWWWVTELEWTLYVLLRFVSGAPVYRGGITSQPTNQPWRLKMHVLCKVGKNIIFQNKTLLVMFYRHNRTFWYQFCNFKHFLKAENSEDSLASSCIELSIGLSCNPVWDWVTDWVTVGTTCWSSPKTARNFLIYLPTESSGFL